MPLWNSCKTKMPTVISAIGSSTHHDDKLFLSTLETGFHGLMRLREISFPNNVAQHNYQKVILRHTVNITEKSYSFWLPGHKANRFYKGNLIIIEKTTLPTDPYSFFVSYLQSQDTLHPLKPELWLRESGSVPTCSWFMKRLHRFFPADIAGQSMHAGGATSLAEAGVPPNIIQAIGRWASDTFQIYIRKNPVLLQAMLFGHPAHQPDMNIWFIDFFHLTLNYSLSNLYYLRFLFWPPTNIAPLHSTQLLSSFPTDI